MNIHETGEVRIHERMPDPEEAEAFEVDVPQPVRASCATSMQVEKDADVMLGLTEKADA